MPAIDVGDPLPNLAVQVENPPGTLVNVGAMSLTVYLPDGTAVPQATPSNPSTGRYVAAAPYYATTGGLHRVRWVGTGANACVKERLYSVGDPVDVDELRAELKVATTTSDDLLLRRLAAAVDVVQEMSGRQLRQETVTEYRPGGKYALRLSRIPVLSVTSVVENGAALTAADYTLDGDTGLLHRGSRWSGASWHEQGAVVTYLAGSPLCPEKFRAAITEHVRWQLGAHRGSSKQPAAGDPDLGRQLVRELIGSTRIPRF